MHATYSVIATPEVLRILVTRLSTFSSKPETETTGHGHGGVEVHSHSQNQRRRKKKSSIFFNKGPSVSKVRDGVGGYYNY